MSGNAFLEMMPEWRLGQFKGKRGKACKAIASRAEAHTGEGKYLSKVQGQVRRVSAAAQDSTANDRKGARWRVRQKSDYKSLTCHFTMPGH